MDAHKEQAKDKDTQSEGELARKGLLVAEALVSSRLVREEQGAGQRWSTRLREENSQWRSHSCPGTRAGTCSSVKRLTWAWKPTEQQEVGKGIVYNQVCYLILLQAWALHLCASAPSFSPSHLSSSFLLETQSGLRLPA